MLGLFLCPDDLGWGSLWVFLFRFLSVDFRLRAHDIVRKSIALVSGLVVAEFRLQLVGAVQNEELAVSFHPAFVKIALIAVATLGFKNAKAFTDTIKQISRIGAAVSILDLAIAIGFVLVEIATNNVSVAKSQLTKTFSAVANEFSGIAQFLEITFSVCDHTVAFSFAVHESALIQSTVFETPDALASHFSVLELSLVLAAVAHNQHAVAMLLAVKPLALVLEERIRVSVDTLANSHFGFGVHIALVAAFLFLIGVFAHALGRVLNFSRFIESGKVSHFKLIYSISRTFDPSEFAFLPHFAPSS